MFENLLVLHLDGNMPTTLPVLNLNFTNFCDIASQNLLNFSQPYQEINRYGLVFYLNPKTVNYRKLSIISIPFFKGIIPSNIIKISLTGFFLINLSVTLAKLTTNKKLLI